MDENEKEMLHLLHNWFRLEQITGQLLGKMNENVSKYEAGKLI